jgi:amino acid adenylation domain-containing protein
MSISNMSAEKLELLKILMAEEGVDYSEVENIPVRIQRHELPLSFAQQRLWFFEQLNPGNPFYNTFQPILITGPLNIAALHQSLNEIVRRHEVLRTTFATNDGQPIQIIAPVMSIPLQLVDLRNYPSHERQQMAMDLAAKDAQRPFTLTTGPLCRLTLIQLGEQEQVLLLTLHHIISDGWSLGVLCKEISALYEDFSTGGQSSLEELAIQYADFAAWQQECLQAEVLDKHLGYWRQQLEGAPPLVELPKDRPRPAMQTYHGATYSFTLPQTLSESLKSFSQREGVTLFMALLAAFKVLLARYSGQSRIVVGTAIANRNRKQIEPLIGFFVNTLVLHTDLSGDPDFREMLGRVRTVTLSAYNHQDLPFEKLVEALQPERALSHSPLYQVEFTLQNSPAGVLEAQGVTLQGLEVKKELAETDLSLIMEETNEGLRGSIDYATDLFDVSTIERMAGHYQSLLEGIIADSDRPISELPLLTEKEYHQLVIERNDTYKEFPHNVCIHQLLEYQAANTPDAVAVVLAENALTYAELNRRANQLAQYLRRSGVGPESLVGIYLHRSIEMTVALLAILKAGGAYVPLDPSYPRERIAFMVKEAQLSVLLTQAQLQDSLPAVEAQVICLNTDESRIAAESDVNPSCIATADNLAYAIFTSGSTGQPKGTLVTHRALVNYTLGFIRQLKITSADRILQFAPLSFDVSVEELFPTWLSGATVVLREDDMAPSYTELVRLIEQEQLTLFELPTVYWHEWVAELTSTRTKVPQCVRTVIIGGDKVSAKRVAEWEKQPLPLVNVYGLTETTVTSTAFTHPAKSATRVWTEMPIGEPLDNTEVYLLDAHLQPVPIGLPGEIFVGGESLARAYLWRPDITAERFIPSPFATGERLYRTGDLARYLADANLVFIGRNDQQVKVRGYRIELGEIETTLKKNLGVQEAIVLALEDHTGPTPLVRRLNDGSIEVEDSDVLTERLQDIGPETAEELLQEIEGLSEEAVEAILAGDLQISGSREQIKNRRFPEFDLVLKLKDDNFIKPPNEAQRNWVVRRALDELADDLKDLDKVTKRFVGGSSRIRLGEQLVWNKDQARYDETQLIIGNQQVMQDWERPLMKAMAEVVTESHGDILELGFGMGISATYIQECGVRSYTVVEYNDGVVDHFNKWKAQYPGRDIRLIHGKWHNVIDQLVTYDGVFFDTVPTDEEEYTREVINNAVMAEDFFPVAAKCLRPGGIFTWYSNEINSLSRRHQRLILKYFSSFTVSVVQPLFPPEDCHYWFADSMVVVKAIK